MTDHELQLKAVALRRAMILAYRVDEDIGVIRRGMAVRAQMPVPPGVEGRSLLDMIREDLVAERIAIDSYGEMIRFVGRDDPTTTRLLEGILAMEEEHADDLASLLVELGGRQRGRSASPRRAARQSKAAPGGAPRRAGRRA